jgi:hypothetical protein
MEHLAYKFHTRGLVGVLFFEVHDQAECAIFERRVGGADDDGIPDISSEPLPRTSKHNAEETYHVMTLSATGDAETPAGGSVCMRCKYGNVSGGESSWTHKTEEEFKKQIRRKRQYMNSFK